MEDPVRLHYSDAIFWVEFFHSCQEAMFSMLPVCSVMITKQNSIKKDKYFPTIIRGDFFFLKPEDKNFVRNIPDVLECVLTSSVSMFTYRKATMAWHTDLEGPIVSKKLLLH